MIGHKNPEAKFLESMEKWQGFKDRNVLSAPRHLGRTAILYSSTFKRSQLVPMHEILAFRNEAEELQSEILEEGRDATIIDHAVGDDFRDVLRDESVSDVIVIGNGSLSSIYSPTRSATRRKSSRLRDTFDWYDVARATTHLKTGSFVQRHCGHLMQLLPVPLGLFALRRPENLFAPVGESFEPEVDPAEEAKMRQVFEEGMPDIDGIRRLLDIGLDQE